MDVSPFLWTNKGGARFVLKDFIRCPMDPVVKTQSKIVSIYPREATLANYASRIIC